MNALDSPLDALAVDYLSFGFSAVVNNLWTWVAVITAAVSFWKIRASGPSYLSPAEPCHEKVLSPVSVSTTLTTEHKGVERRKPVPGVAPPVKFQVGGGDFDADTVTKGKFTLYYHKDLYREGEEEEEVEEQLVKRSAESESESIYRLQESLEWWERMLRVRRGDNSWYRCQDLTAFNGDVVRFWE